MGENRMEELLRCPTLEQPSLEYFQVRLPWQSFAVRRETAEKVLEAMLGFERAEWIRIETVGGSVAWVRIEHVMFVREWSSAQRESERRFWQQIDDEYEEAEKAAKEERASEGSESRASEDTSGGRVSLGLIVLVLWVAWLTAAAISVAVAH